MQSRVYFYFYVCFVFSSLSSFLFLAFRISASLSLLFGLHAHGIGWVGGGTQVYIPGCYYR